METHEHNPVPHFISDTAKHEAIRRLYPGQVSNYKESLLDLITGFIQNALPGCGSNPRISNYGSGTAGTSTVNQTDPWVRKMLSA